MNKLNKLKPVLRYPGSKFKKLEKIFENLKPTKNDLFIDLFGGSGIVGVNANYIFGCQTIINDYDDVISNLTEESAMDNRLRFDGYGSYTKHSEDQFLTRVNNGFWNDYEKFKETIKKCELVSFNVLLDATQLKNKISQSKGCFERIVIYIDPPYYKINNLYKHDWKDVNFHTHLRNMLEQIAEKFKGLVVMLISYNDEEYVRKLYDKWRIEAHEHQNYVGAGKTRKKVKELFITNKEKEIK